MSTARVYPAYSRTIAIQKARGQRPIAIAVLLSARWHYFDRALKTCIRPDEWRLGRWEFGYLRNEHGIAVWGEQVEPAQFGELLIELMLAGPRMLWACDIAGKWLYREPDPWGLGRYAIELTKGEQTTAALAGVEAYEEGQLRDLGLIQREAERAAQLKRERVGILEQRSKALELVELIFAGDLVNGRR